MIKKASNINTSLIIADQSTTAILPRTMSRSLVLLLVHLSYLWEASLCNKVFVTTSTNNELQCSVVPCATLTQIATNSSAYLDPDENNTLMLQQGHHQLDSNLTVSSVEGLSLLITSGHSTLDKPSVSVKLARFSNISWLKISGVNFNRSGSITVESVEQFTLENSTFLESTGTPLTLSNTSASIISSFFIFNSPGTHRGPFETVIYGGYSFAQVGGAVTVTQSSATILHTLFEGNYAEYGGAVYSELNSQLQIIDSYFMGNKATAGGGALYIVSGCHVTIIDSDYQNNTAISVEQDSLGGTLMSFDSIIFINHSIFSHNMVSDKGGVIWASNTILNINNISLYSNSAREGAMFMVLSKINITESRFINNIGGVVKAMFVNMNARDNYFTRNSANVSQYGGAMWLKMTNATFTNCNFTENTADTGGVLEVDSTNLALAQCKFFKNYAIWGGVMRALGGSFVTTTENSIIENNSGHQGIMLFMESNSIVSNVKFINNKGSFIAHQSSVTFEYTSFTNGSQLKTDEIITYLEGGAITGFRSNIVLGIRCIMRHNNAENGGAIYVTQSKLNVLGRLLLLSNNSATDSGGGIFLYQSELHCLETSTIWFKGNNAHQKGGAIHAVSSHIEVNHNVTKQVYSGSRVHFTENKAPRGGAISLEMISSFHIIVADTDSHLTFTNLYIVFFTRNQADFGGAVYVADETNPSTCASKLNSTYSTTTECFLQSLALRTKSVLHLSNIDFTQNQAKISGNSLFGGLLDRCTISTFSITYDKEHKTLTGLPHGVAYLLLVSNIQDFQQISSEPIQLRFCRNNEPDPDYQGPPIEIKAGETFPVSIAAVDQVNHTVEATIRSSLTTSTSGLGEGQLIQKVTKKCTNLTFTVFTPSEKEELIMYAEGPCKDASASQLRLPIQISACECSIGFQRKYTNRPTCECECDSALVPHITKCDTQRKTVIREHNFWITYTSRGNKSGYVIHPNCPLDYCYPASANIEINLTIQGGTDAQCEYDRMGKLCGTCKPGLSLSLSSPRCLQCSRYWPIVFVVIVLAALLLGIVLVASLLILNLTVAAGTLNGLIFYANIVYANSNIYFPHGQPRFITTFVAWLNLDLGIDVCFFDGLDAYWKTWLQLAFPAYLVFLVIAVIAASKWSTKFSQLVGKRNPVATLATLILLSYAKFLHVIIAALSFTTLHYPDGSSEVVWLPDATVTYFLGKHSALFIAALLVLTMCTVYTILIFLWQWLLYLQDKKQFRWLLSQKLSLFIEPYQVPYIPQHRYWTGLLLLVRIVIYLTSAVNVSSDPSVSLLVTGIVVSFLLFLKGYSGSIYRNWLIGSMEVGCYLNIVLLSFITLYLLSNDGHLLAAAYISGFITLALTLIVLAYHTFTELISKTKLWQGVNDRLTHRQLDTGDETSVELISTQSLLTSTTVNAPPRGESIYSEYREELLEPAQRETGNTFFTKSKSY